MNSSTIYFLLFCSLLALRDGFSQVFLHEEGVNLHPAHILFVWCWTATVLAWVFQVYRRGIRDSAKSIATLERRQWIRAIKLGVATLGVYLATIWGIKFIGAPVFNLIDYAGMPLLTMLAGLIMLKEERTVSTILPSIAGVVGVFVMFFAGQEGRSEVTHSLWISGIGLAICSAILTSYCIVVQKRQVDDGMHPDQVLLLRFPISALCMSIWVAVIGPPHGWKVIGALVFVGAVGMFLPLLLLCFGFMRATLGKFSRFLLLIPLFTWLLVPILVEREVKRLGDPFIVLGATVLFLAYGLSEYLDYRRRSCA